MTKSTEAASQEHTTAGPRGHQVPGNGSECWRLSRLYPYRDETLVEKKLRCTTLATRRKRMTSHLPRALWVYWRGTQPMPLTSVQSRKLTRSMSSNQYCSTAGNPVSLGLVSMSIVRQCFGIDDDIRSVRSGGHLYMKTAILQQLIWPATANADDGSFATRRAIQHVAFILCSTVKVLSHGTSFAKTSSSFGG